MGKWLPFRGWFLAPIGHDVPLVVVGGLHGGGDEIQGITATHPPVRLDVSPKTVVFVTPRVPETFKLTDIFLRHF